MLLFALLTAIAYWVFQYIQLSTTFDFGRPHATPQESVAAQRDWYIDQAQWGNLALYGGEDPFVGSGRTHQTWSIVVELDRKPPTPGAAAGERRNATIDPADLHAFIRERLEQMRTGVLNERESIAKLTVSDHLTVPGTLYRGNGGHPLLGPDGMPLLHARPGIHRRGQAEPAGRDALLPAGHRGRRRTAHHHRRGDAGRAGLRSGRPTSPPSSTWRSRGGMMYTQCLIMALPPCRRSFHVIDVLPALSPIAVVGKALAALRLRLFEEVLFAPVRLVKAVFDQNRQQRPDRFLAYPYGARASVRELGAEREPTSFMQALDIDKYSKLISQRTQRGGPRLSGGARHRHHVLSSAGHRQLRRVGERGDGQRTDRRGASGAGDPAGAS